MKQETLEQVAERIYPDCNNVIRQMAKETFIKGAKWSQERSYSEEEVIELLQWLTDDESIYSIMYGHKKYRFATNDKDFTSKEILEQFKKNKL